MSFPINKVNEKKACTSITFAIARQFPLEQVYMKHFKRKMERPHINIQMGNPTVNLYFYINLYWL